MKQSALSIILGALGLALAVAGSAGARAEATRIQLTATLNATQEVPAPTGNLTVARGTFTATVTASGEGVIVNWRLTFSGLSGAAAAAHIHVAPRGQAGPVAVPLCSPCESGASGRATVEASVLTALASGRAYANVHTAANAAGEIRGQVAVVARIRTVLNAGQEVPKPKGNVDRGRATFSATITKSGSMGVLSWRLTFSGLTSVAVAAHIHLGARGKAGPVAVALCGPCRSGVSRDSTVRASVLKALEAGRAYVNVHTARNPAGEVRGQIAAVPMSITVGSSGPTPPPPPPPPPPYP